MAFAIPVDLALRTAASVLIRQHAEDQRGGIVEGGEVSQQPGLAQLAGRGPMGRAVQRRRVADQFILAPALRRLLFFHLPALAPVGEGLVDTLADGDAGRPAIAATLLGAEIEQLDIFEGIEVLEPIRHEPPPWIRL